MLSLDLLDKVAKRLDFHSTAVIFLDFFDKDQTSLNITRLHSTHSTRWPNGSIFSSIFCRVKNRVKNRVVWPGPKDIIVNDVELLISSKNSFLGASLDGIVQCNQDTWVLEIKCPYSKYNSTLSSALTDKKFFLKKNDTIELKRSHPYYYQIQGQMYCSGLKRVDLAVWFGDSEPLCIMTIHYDEKFMEKHVLPRLEYF